MQKTWPYTITAASLDCPLIKPPSNLSSSFLSQVFWICLGERGKGQHLPYPATSLVVLQVHQHASLLLWTSHVVLLPLLGIHKLLGKTISILHVIPAAAPEPVSGQVLGPGRPAAATAGELSFPTSPADRIHHSGGTDSVGESSFSAPCERDIRSKLTSDRSHLTNAMSSKEQATGLWIVGHGVLWEGAWN